MHETATVCGDDECLGGLHLRGVGHVVVHAERSIGKRLLDGLAP